MQKQIISCTHRKALASPSSAILKHLLEIDNYARRCNSNSFVVFRRTDTTFKLCVKEALLIHRHKPTINTQKEAYETIRTRLQREAATSLLKPCKDARGFCLELLVNAFL